MLSEPAPFLRNPLSQNLQELLIRYRIMTLPSLSYTRSETYGILFHLADPDFRAPHLLNMRGGAPESYDRAYQLSTTKTTTTMTTTMTTTELSRRNNTRTWLSSRYYNIDCSYCVWYCHRCF
jgi:hypothetical protein